MKIPRCLTLCLILGAVSFGCASQLPVIDLPVAFDAKETAQRLQSGRNEVHSMVNFRRQFGGSANCIYGLVTLVPATPYAVAWVSEFYENPEVSWPVGKAAFMEKNTTSRIIRESEPFLAASRQTLCNSDSRFEFRDLADGDYFVMVNVLWRHWGYPAMVGSLVTRTHVYGGEQRQIIWPSGLIDLE